MAHLLSGADQSKTLYLGFISQGMLVTVTEFQYINTIKLYFKQISQSSVGRQGENFMLSYEEDPSSPLN